MVETIAGRLIIYSTTEQQFNSIKYHFTENMSGREYNFSCHISDHLIYTNHMNIILEILKYLAIALVSVFSLFIIGGLIVKKRGQSEIDEASLIRDGAKLAVNSDGRRIEYFVYGNTNPNAPVIVNIHGSGIEGNFEKSIYQPICEKLGVRGISISLPGYGNTDMKIGRAVSDWASEDLEPVLNQEGVQDFMITGHSQGNPHAMAAAYYFKERCTGLGLYAPLLPNDVSKEIGIVGALGAKGLKTTEELKSPFMAWYFFLIYLSCDLFSPFLPLKLITTTTPKMTKDTVFVAKMKKTLARVVIRGSAGSAWETAKDVCYDWGFDPRLIETKNISIWHAVDDTFCPPEIGAWLAKYFTEKGATVNFKNENEGSGHFTYSQGKYTEAEHSLVKALLDGTKQV
jgi:pimeloyl-ACP methyl ester carboxylesterase